MTSYDCGLGQLGFPMAAGLDDFTGVSPAERELGRDRRDGIAGMHAFRSKSRNKLGHFGSVVCVRRVRHYFNPVIHPSDQ